MNKHSSQSGFGVVEVLLILVILGIIGFTGWRVYEANREVSQTPVYDSTITKQKETPPQNYLTYTSPERGYKFDYPKSWQTTTTEYEGFTVQSPDYTASDEGIGFHLTQGARMFIRVENTSLTTPDALLATKDLQNTAATDREKMKVDGQDALRYRIQYETSPSLTTLLVKDGKGYYIDLDFADDTALGKYKTEYDNLIKSFKLTD